MIKRCLIIALAVCFYSAAAQAGVFFPETTTLDNGLQIVVVPNHLAPAVTQMVWYKVGSSDEVPGKSGIAHYLEHLMFRGTDSMPPGEFSKKIAAQGGNDNAFTSYDYTAFHETVAADRLEMAMQMEADRMQNLRITPVTATPELKVVLNERQQRTDNSPDGRFEEKLRHALMPNYPYGIPVIGWKPEIEKLTAEDADNWYQRHYAPNNAVVIISGDVTMDEVKRLAAETYGKIPKRDVPKRRDFPQPAKPTDARVVVTDAGVEQPRIQLDIVSPSYSTQKSGEAYAYEVLSEVLDSGEVGVLYHDLVADQGVASGEETNYDPDARGDAVFTIALVPQPGKMPEALEKALTVEMQNLAQKGLDSKMIEDAKKRLIREAVFARDSLMAPGYVFGSAITTGHTVDDVEVWPDRIKAVTPERVNAALRDLAANPNRIVGMLLPDKNASAAAKAAAHKPALSRDQSIR